MLPLRAFHTSVLLVGLSIAMASAPRWCAAEEQPGLRLYGVGRAPHGRLHPDGWLVLRITLANTSDADISARIVATFPSIPSSQSARRIVVPSLSEERLDLPVFVPAAIDAQAATDVTVSVYKINETDDGRPAEERLADVDGVPLRSDLHLQVEQSPNKLVMSLNLEPRPLLRWQWPLREDYHNYEFLVASRVHAGNSRTMIDLGNMSLPLARTDWHNISSVVVSEASIFDDATHVLALQQFVNEGGRLWFMLDRIPTRFVQNFLGNGQTCTEIDTVELNSFDVQVHSSGHRFSPADLHFDSDQPVVLKRVMQVGGHVSHSVDGWPAAIWMPVGYGEVLLTPLASAGWLREGTESADPQMSTSFRIAPFGSPLALNLHEQRVAPPIDPSAEYPLELIGNPVLPRSRVALILLSFLALLMAMVLVCWSAGRLGRLGWSGPSLALLVALVLVMNSASIRRDIPETHAQLQVIQVGENGQSASVREQGVVYLSAERAMKLEGQQDGYALAHENIQTGIKQFQIDGEHRWQLKNMAWPPGSWRYQSRFVVDTDNLVALGRLDSEGLQLQLPPAVEGLADPVIAYAPGNPMLGQRLGSVVRADGSLMGAADRWISGSIIGDEQGRRIAIYQQFFAAQDRRYPPRTTLLGWMPAWNGVQCSPGDLRSVGGALVGLPIRLLRPAAGERLLIPPGLVRLVKDTQQVGQTSAYIEEAGAWAPGVNLGVQADLQCVLPPEVIPFRAESIEFHLDIRAPHRVVRLLSRAASPPVEIVRLENPSVPWQATIDNPLILDDLRDGRLDITLEVSERTDIKPGENATSVVTWQLGALQTTVRGSRTSELTGEDGLARRQQ